MVLLRIAIPTISLKDLLQKGWPKYLYVQLILFNRQHGQCILVFNLTRNDLIGQSTNSYPLHDSWPTQNHPRQPKTKRAIIFCLSAEVVSCRSTVNPTLLFSASVRDLCSAGRLLLWTCLLKRSAKKWNLWLQQKQRLSFPCQFVLNNDKGTRISWRSDQAM